MNSPTLKTLIWYIIYESSPYSVIPVIYIQPEGGHVGFCQDVGPMAANMLKIWYCRPLDHIWCSWKNLNQTVPLLP